MRHLETTTGRTSGLGSVTTSVVYSSPLPNRAITPAPAGKQEYTSHAVGFISRPGR